MMLHRRDAMIRLGQFGLGAMTLPTLLRAERARADAPIALVGSGKAKSCILVYLWGGPPQMDTFDVKPEAPEGIRSHFKPIDTVVPGIQICDQLPQLAKHTDKTAILRSLTHQSNIHEVGVYHTLTGKVNPSLAGLRNRRNRGDFPNVGAIVSNFSPPNLMPNTVTVPRPIGHDGVIYSGTYAGFLGPRHDPIELQPPAEVNAPAAHDFTLPEALDEARIQARFGLLNRIQSMDQRLQSARATKGLDYFRDQALRMLTAPEAKSAFSIEKEPDNLRDRYGRNEYGEAFLLCRRLIESGVRLVTLVWYYVCPDGNVANVWDNHGGTGSLGGITGYEMLKSFYCLPSLDQGFSALLEDMSERGLLDECIVASFGEFGRTPKINAASGRDHWGPCQSAILAGGGIRGGQVYGASDAHAAYPKSNPVAPEDIHATIYHALGLSPELTVLDQQRRPHRITEGNPIVELFG
jgi:hypothetical protein